MKHASWKYEDQKKISLFVLWTIPVEAAWLHERGEVQRVVLSWVEREFGCVPRTKNDAAAC